ncbi:nitrate assimilation regulatory protein nirA [Purpureocillium lilacinum]|uniref:Nitrate assimilation regulatory protein nirA n=1 Tax=Purpureocillium lilacinum TaxID=33203 RepID=A0A179GXF9_PURLI|nr:nitrate assimilation regulatory protein nirA [Purpureocillium lilacinum]OAQ82584.1 nitrate assimilation regulatory protein nirA [Purpureocillium lilacinum]
MHTLLQQPALPLSHLDGPPIHEADELGFRDLPASGPNLAQKYYDERLNRLELSNWTSVAIADDFAASVLSNYLELNHPVLGLFDAGLFLRDLTNLQHDFCSTFLVNATLAFACQSFTGIDLRAAPLASAFIREAERLWRSEGLLDSALNVASILMLSVSIHTYGGDLKVTDLLDGGRCMAQRLGMFGPQLRSPSGVGSGEVSVEHQRSMAHIAHGAYSSLCTFYYPQNPTHLPPLRPATGPDSFGKSASEPLGIPAEATELPAIVDSKFTALCQFWSIMQVVATTYFASRPRSKSVREPIPLHFAESTYRKLLAWANTLEGAMSRENGGPDQLKGLLLDCRQDRRKMLLIAHTNAAILHVSNAMLLDAADRAGRGSPQDPDCRPYFLLCLANCRDMYTCFPVFGSVGRGLLAMAMRDGVMDSESAKRLVATLDSRGTHHDPTARRALGTFTIDFALAMREPEHAEAATLARQFDELTLFADLTTGTW